MVLVLHISKKNKYLYQGQFGIIKRNLKLMFQVLALHLRESCILEMLLVYLIDNLPMGISGRNILNKHTLKCFKTPTGGRQTIWLKDVKSTAKELNSGQTRINPSE